MTQQDIDHVAPAAERYAPPSKGAALIPALALLCVAMMVVGCALLAWGVAWLVRL